MHVTPPQAADGARRWHYPGSAAEAGATEMAKPKRPPTWLDVAVHNVGLRLAVRALNWAYCWAVVREALGHDPSVEEVAEWWNMARRTAFRDQADFRKAFPTLETPAPLYASPEARAAIARHAEFGDKVEKWGAERRARREATAIGIAQLPATQ